MPREEIARTVFLTENSDASPYDLQQGECTVLQNNRRAVGELLRIRQGIGGGASNGPVVQIGQTVRQIGFGRLSDGTELVIFAYTGNLRPYTRTAGAPPTYTGFTTRAVADVLTVPPIQFYQGHAWAVVDGTLYFYSKAADSWTAAGISAPISAPSGAAGAAGVLTGDYRYKVTFVRTIDGRSAISDPSGNSTTITLSSQQASLSSIPTGPAGTTAREIYRSKRDAFTREFLTYQYVTCINDNVTTVYTDNANDESISFNKALEEDHGTPPTDIVAAYLFKDWMVLARRADIVQISKTQQPETFPAAYAVALDELQSSRGSIKALSGDEQRIYAFKSDATYALAPTGSVEAPLIVDIVDSVIGTVNHSSVVSTPAGTVTCTDDNIYILNGGRYTALATNRIRNLYKSLRDTDLTAFNNMRVLTYPDWQSVIILLGNTSLVWCWENNTWSRLVLADASWKATAGTGFDQSVTNDLAVFAVNRAANGDIGEFPQSTLNDFGTVYTLVAETGELGTSAKNQLGWIGINHTGTTGTLTIKTYIAGALKQTLTETVTASKPIIRQINQQTRYMKIRLETSSDIPIGTLWLERLGVMLNRN